MDLYISKHCDQKANLNLAIAQAVACVPGCDADKLAHSLKKILCDELYEQTLAKRKSSEFFDGEWPVLRTSSDEFANNQPCAQTMTVRRESVTAVYKAAGFQGSVAYPYIWVAEQGRIVKALRHKYSNENTYRTHWISYLQFVKIVAPELVESYGEAFKALERPNNAPDRDIMPVETLDQIRESNTIPVEQAIHLLEGQANDSTLDPKGLKPVMAALVVECNYGAQPMRRGDWLSVKLPSANDIDVSNDNFLSVQAGRVILTMNRGAKIGQLTTQLTVDFTVASPRLNGLLLLVCQTMQSPTGFLFVSPTGLQYTPTGFSNLLKNTMVKQLGIQLPCYGVTTCRHAVVNEEREENAKKQRTRGVVRTEKTNAKQRLHSTGTANQVYGVA
jgi:hypothetical protein